MAWVHGANAHTLDRTTGVNNKWAARFNRSHERALTHIRTRAHTHTQARAGDRPGRCGTTWFLRVCACGNGGGGGSSRPRLRVRTRPQCCVRALLIGVHHYLPADRRAIIIIVVAGVIHWRNVVQSSRSTGAATQHVWFRRCRKKLKMFRLPSPGDQSRFLNHRRRASRIPLLFFIFIFEKSLIFEGDPANFYFLSATYARGIQEANTRVRFFCSPPAPRLSSASRHSPLAVRIRLVDRVCRRHVFIIIFLSSTPRSRFTKK